MRLVFGSDNVYLANVDRYVEHSLEGMLTATRVIVLLKIVLSRWTPLLLLVSLSIVVVIVVIGRMYWYLLCLYL